jgi:hypothetical protein
VLGAVAAVEMLSAAIYDASAALAGNKIGAEAASAGVGTTFFQSWTQQAKDLNHETSDMVAMLEKFREASTDSIQNVGRAGDKHTGSPGEDREA